MNLNEFLRAYESVPIVVSAEHEDLVPEYANEGDAGADLRSKIDATIQPGERMLIPTGVTLVLSEGLVGLIHPRSGLALKHGITVLNSPGTIDSGYRGEISVLLYNSSKEPFKITTYDRIAQLVIQPYVNGTFILLNTPTGAPTSRGEGGFGSTGIA